MVNSIAHRILGKSGAEEVLSSENGFIFLKLDCYDSLNSVLERAPWHMANRPLVLKRWQPNLTLSKEDVKRVPILVKLYNLPLEFWTPKCLGALSYLSSAFWNPFHLHTDKITARRKRISYARVCVEVDASTELVKEFDPRCDNGEWITIKAELECEG